MPNTKTLTNQQTRYFVPKQLLFEANKHDGTKESAEALARWINKLDPARTAEAVDGFTENVYYVVYDEDSGDEFVTPDIWVVWLGHGSFALYEESEFKSLFQPAPDERLVEEGLALDIPS